MSLVPPTLSERERGRGQYRPFSLEAAWEQPCSEPAFFSLSVLQWLPFNELTVTVVGGVFLHGFTKENLA